MQVSKIYCGGTQESEGFFCEFDISTLFFTLNTFYQFHLIDTPLAMHLDNS